MSSYALVLEELPGQQSSTDTSYIGGKPRLPENVVIPTCSLCSSEHTFFYQTECPPDNSWVGLSLAVFACTSCAHEEFLIPQLLIPLENARIPAGFLSEYQVNFRFLVFPTDTASIRDSYVEKVQFHRWSLVKNDRAGGNKLGGDPEWLLGDESPHSYADATPLLFLMQLEENFTFPTLAGAAPQMEIDFSGPVGAQEPSDAPYYNLFLGNVLYLFGTLDNAEHLVYAVVQGT